MRTTLIPTPILPLSPKGDTNRYFIKREDLLPFSFGGNKVRIAEEYFKDMAKEGASCIISYGGRRSNLNRIIAVMSRSLKIPCYVVCPKDHEAADPFNHRIVKRSGAVIVPTSREDVADTIGFVLKECRAKGLTPYYINGDRFGQGREHVAVRAYAETYREILGQEEAAGVKFRYIFHASGTGSTQAGLLCGQILTGGDKQIIGISAARDEAAGRRAIGQAMAAYFEHHPDPRGRSLGDAPDITFLDRYVCGGYGKSGPPMREMIRRVFYEDGIALDTTYTGKAFWGMREYIRDEGIEDSDILFLHTGGSPLFFDDLAAGPPQEREEAGADEPVPAVT